MFEQEPPTFSNPEKTLLWNGKRKEITLRHFERDSYEYILWMKAGQMTPPLPQSPDPNYNSNIWQNFKNHSGLRLSANDCTISESMAMMYPFTLPTYSQMGELSLERFLEESSYLKNSTLKSWILKSSHKQLKLLSHLRDPLQDDKGNILPHKNYISYPSIKSQPTTKSSPLPIFGVPRDLFGRKIDQKKKNQCIKLTSKKTNVQRKQALKWVI